MFLSVHVINRESLTVVDHYFPLYGIQDQDILSRKESVDKVLALVPEDILSTKCCTFISQAERVKLMVDDKMTV